MKNLMKTLLLVAFIAATFVSTCSASNIRIKRGPPRLPGPTSTWAPPGVTNTWAPSESVVDPTSVGTFTVTGGTQP
jgi:hypothetical protein